MQRCSGDRREQTEFPRRGLETTKGRPVEKPDEDDRQRANCTGPRRSVQQAVHFHSLNTHLEQFQQVICAAVWRIERGR